MGLLVNLKENNQLDGCNIKNKTISVEIDLTKLRHQCVWEALELAALGSYGEFTESEMKLLKEARDIVYFMCQAKSVGPLH